MKKFLIGIVAAILLTSCGTAYSAPRESSNTVITYYATPEMYRVSINGAIYIVTVYKYLDRRTGQIRYRTVYHKIYDMYPVQPWNYGRPRPHHEHMPRPRPIQPPHSGPHGHNGRR